MSTPAVQSDYKSAQGSGTSIVVDRPTSLVAGNLLVAVIGSGGFNAVISSPAGWTQSATVTTSGRPLTVFHKMADSGDAAASNFTFTSTVSGSLRAFVCRVTGADASTPIAATATANNIIAPSVTTTADNQLVLRACAYYGDETSHGLTTPGDHTQIHEYTSSENECLGVAYEAVATAGDAGTCVFDSFNEDLERGVSIAIAEAADPGGTLTNLIAYWRMDESSGTRYDSVGSFDASEAAGTVGTTTAKLGSNAASKNSSGSLTALNLSGDLSDTSVTFAGWIKLTTLPVSGTTNEICELQLWDGVDEYRSVTLYFDATDDHLWIQTQDANAETTSDVKATTFGAISANTWYHVIVTWNGAGASLFVNNTEDSGSAESFAGCLTVKSVNFGQSASPGDLYCYDEWGIWNEIISATDRSDLYNSGTGAVPPGLGSPAGSGNQSAFFGFHGF